MTATGLVLAGAAALGAYQVGVLSYLVNQVAAELGKPLGFDVLSGTSAGAIHAGAMATGADDPIDTVNRLEQAWTEMRLERVLRPSAIEIVAMILDLTDAPDRFRRALRARGARGALLDARPIEQLCTLAVDPPRIAENLRHQRFRAVALSATNVATGGATSFYQSLTAPRTTSDRTMIAVRLNPEHARASAAIPLLFPAVAIADELYCDGGLRHMVPLSPALHLGARRVVLVSSVAHPTSTDAATAAARRAAVSSPLYLAGKALDALFSDGVEGDIDRMAQVNRLLAAGTRRYGDAFAAELDVELAAMGAPPLRPVDLVQIRPSRDLGAMASDYLGSQTFAARARGPIAALFRYLDGDTTQAGGLLSYLLFDGGFAAELIALGRSDAQRQHAALVELLSDASSTARQPKN